MKEHGIAAIIAGNISGDGLNTRILLFLLILSLTPAVQSQNQNGKLKNLETWYQKELYNQSCPLKGVYSAGKGDKMQIFYCQNVEGTKDYIVWMGEKTWVSTDSTMYDINDTGTGFVTISCFIGRSNPAGGEPSVFSGNKLKMTYHIYEWQTQEITLDGPIYMKEGLKRGWRATYARTLAEKGKSSQTNTKKGKTP